MANEQKPQATQYFYDTGGARTIECKDGFVFGRTEGNVQFPDDAKVSRTHWELKINDDGVFLYELGSSNGTKINDVEIEGRNRSKLTRGDVILFGEQKLVFTGDTKDLPEGAQITPVQKSISFSLEIETTEPTMQRMEMEKEASKEKSEKIELSLGSRQVRIMKEKAEEEARRVVKRAEEQLKKPNIAISQPTRTVDLELARSIARGEWSIALLLIGLIVPAVAYVRMAWAVFFRGDLLFLPGDVIPRYAGVFVLLPLMILGGHLFAMQRFRPRHMFRILIALAEVAVFLSLSGNLKMWTGLHEQVTANQIWYGCMVVGEEDGCRGQIKPAFNQQVFKGIPTKQRLAIEDKFPAIQFPSVQ